MFTVAQSLLTTLRQSWIRHPKRWVVLLASSGFLSAGAYAVATVVDSLAPPAQLAQQDVSEIIQPLNLQSQVVALENRQLRLYRSDVTRSTDTADTLLQRLGVNDPLASNFLRTDPVVQQHLLKRAGRMVKAETSQNDTLLALSARWSPDDDGSFKRLLVERQNGGFVARLETAALSASSRLASGTIQTSLFAATDEAQIPDAVAIQIAEIFSGDIDFHRALRKGDRFSVVYETLEADGEPLRAGRVLSTEFVNDGKTFQAMWFQEPTAQSGAQAPKVSHTQTKGGYFTLDGKSLRRAFLASPLAFSRISSGFKMRFHPILQTWRAHLGVDYAAVAGTPVRSVGDGVVEFAGFQNGFGNVVILRHGNGNSTVYAHLSQVAVKRGQSISQGQHLGAVGATGWATGPHLHFEFRVNGQHKDPLAMARQSDAVPVPQALRPEFNRLASDVRQQLAAANWLRPGGAN